MKKIKLIAGIFLMITTFTFLSCENEPIDSALNLDDFNTSCDAPQDFQASDFINSTNVNLSWTSGSDETSWEIQYGLQGFTVGSGTSVTAAITNYTVTGLNPANTYSFYVRAKCSATSNSQWVGPVIVQAIDVNPNCASPTNFVASRNATTNTNVNVSWTAGGTETSWEIQYGNTGFALGSGINITSTASPDLITNINTANAFDFYIRAACSGTEFSSWIGPVSVPAVGGGGTTTPLYMNATINGQAYNGMKPFYYPFTGLKAKLYTSDPSKTLWIQGDTNPLDPTLVNNLEINLHITEALWHTGTYTLYGHGNEPENAADVDLIIITPSNPAEVYEDEIDGGTLTITEFNTTTKRIKGTFSFSYMINDNGTLTGPFQVANGSFDFEMDDSVFN